MKALTHRAIGRLVVIGVGILLAINVICGIAGGRPDIRKIPFRLVAAGVDAAPEGL